MTNADRLSTSPPRPALTVRQRIERDLGRVLLAVALVLGGLGLYTAIKAVDCVNNTLGDRGPITKLASSATVDFISQIVTVLTAPPGSQRTVYLSALPKMTHDKNVLVAAQEARNRTPLGKC